MVIESLKQSHKDQLSLPAIKPYYSDIAQPLGEKMKIKSYLYLEFHRPLSNNTPKFSVPQLSGMFSGFNQTINIHIGIFRSPIIVPCSSVDSFCVYRQYSHLI